ncbi:MAG: Heavy-metal-associated domain [Bryobacterales bacterium]|jgi:copper chaperone CopZ|nr:Heavy-metal-associated domain [Bryobacterales bacterium]
MAKSKIEMSVPDMSGDGVVRNIETSLSGVRGVEYAHVNLGAGKITVEYDDAVATADQLIGTVKQLGFDVLQV